MRCKGQWVEVAMPSSPYFRRRGRLVNRGPQISARNGQKYIWEVLLEKTEVDPAESITMNEFWLHRMVKFVFFRS